MSLVSDGSALSLYTPPAVEAMKASASLATLLAQALLLTACSKPSRVVRIDSPGAGVFQTVEISHGRGAISNDFTRIYAHFDNAGQTDKQLLLDGEHDPPRRERI